MISVKPISLKMAGGLMARFLCLGSIDTHTVPKLAKSTAVAVMRAHDVTIGVTACQKGHVVRFFRTSAQANQLLEAKKGGRLKQYMKTLEKADLIICDE